MYSMAFSISSSLSPVRTLMFLNVVAWPAPAPSVRGPADIISGPRSRSGSRPVALDALRGAAIVYRKPAGDGGIGVGMNFSFCDHDRVPLPPREIAKTEIH